MELIDGEDLAARLRRTGALSVAEVARLGLDISRALGVAHIRGIVHRDVKPGNILLARDGRALITDFGIARLAADAEGTPGTTLGSVQYFSPEQAQGAATTPASDIYGLGLVMYEALTGRRPWRGDTPSQLALARVGKPAPSPRDVRADVPVDLDAVVRRALAPDPESRFSSGAAMAGFLEPIVGLTDPTVRARTSGRGPAASGAALRPSRVTQARRRSGRGRRVATVVVAAIALLAAGRWAVAALPADGTATRVRRRPPRAPAARRRVAPRHARPPTAEADREARPRSPPPSPRRSRSRPRRRSSAAPVCEPFLGLACSLDAGRYRSSAFDPSIDFTVGKGWSNANSSRDQLELARDEGSLTYASSCRTSGRGVAGRGDAPATARALVDAFATTEGRDREEAGRRCASTGTAAGRVDLTTAIAASTCSGPTRGRRTALEPGRTTRMVALDVGDRHAAGHGHRAGDGHTLRQLLDVAADDVAASDARSLTTLVR